MAALNSSRQRPVINPKMAALALPCCPFSSVLPLANGGSIISVQMPTEGPSLDISAIGFETPQKFNFLLIDEGAVE